MRYLIYSIPHAKRQIRMRVMEIRRGGPVFLTVRWKVTYSTVAEHFLEFTTVMKSVQYREAF